LQFYSLINCMTHGPFSILSNVWPVNGEKYSANIRAIRVLCSLHILQTAVKMVTFNKTDLRHVSSQSIHACIRTQINTYINIYIHTLSWKMCDDKFEFCIGKYNNITLSEKYRWSFIIIYYMIVLIYKK
jgi:hypothetical protein